MNAVSNSRNTSSGLGDGLLYLLIGGGIGAAVALLFAPKSGSELRHDISDITRKGYDETLELAHQLKEQSAELYGAIQQRTGDIYDFATSKFRHAERAGDEAAESFDGILQLDDRSSPPIGQKQKAANRKPASIL